MDFDLLQTKIKKSPDLYENEYLNVLKTYTSMIDLPLIPDTSNYIQFLSLTCHNYNHDIAGTILAHFNRISDSERKKRFFYYLGTFYRKQKITRDQYIDCIFACQFKIDLLKTASDLLHKFENDKSRSDPYNLRDIANKIEQYLKSEIFLLRKTALFFIIFIYHFYDLKSLNKTILNCLNDPVTQSMVIDHILELLSLEKPKNFKAKLSKNKKRGKKGFDYKNYRNDQKMLQIEKKMKKTSQFHQKKDVQDILDQTSPVTTAISDIIPDTASDAFTPNEVSADQNLYENMSKLMKISKIITEMENPKKTTNLLLSHIKDHKDDRNMRLKKLKTISLIKSHFGISVNINTILLRMIDPFSPDLPFVIHILIRSVEKSEMKTVITKIQHLFMRKPDSDMRCYALNLLKEIVLIDRSPDILRTVQEIAQNNKNDKIKGIFYAHTTLMRAIKYGTTDNKSVQFHMRRRKLL